MEFIICTHVKIYLCDLFIKKRGTLGRVLRISFKESLPKSLPLYTLLIIMERNRSGKIRQNVAILQKMNR